MKLRPLRWRNYPRLSGQDQCSHKAVYKRERGMSGREGDAMPEAEVWVGSHMSVYSQECLGKGRGRERGWGGESAC